MRRQTAQPQRPILLIQSRKSLPAADYIHRGPEPGPRTQIAETDGRAGAGVCGGFGGGGVRAPFHRGEEADAGEEGPEGG